MEKELDVFDKLCCFKVTLQEGERSTVLDRKYIQLYQEGIANKDLHKMYQCIDACERGCGFPSIEQVQEIWNLGSKQDFERACSCVDKGSGEVINAVILTMCMNESQKQRYLLNETLHNAYILYELIRKSLKYVTRKRMLNETDRKAVAAGIIRLSENEKFWIYFLQEHENNVGWLQVLSDVLSGISEEALIIYANTVDLSHGIKDLDLITQAYRNLSDTVVERIHKVADSIFIKRWQEYLDKKEKEHTFENKLLLNAYINVIYWAYCEKYQNKQDVEDYLSRQLDLLFEHQYEWYEKFTHQSSLFFLDVTEIYLLLLCRKEKASHAKWESVLREKLENLKKMLEQYSLYWEKGYEREIEEITTLI